MSNHSYQLALLVMLFIALIAIGYSFYLYTIVKFNKLQVVIKLRSINGLYYQITGESAHVLSMEEVNKIISDKGHPTATVLEITYIDNNKPT